MSKGNQELKHGNEAKRVRRDEDGLLIELFLQKESASLDWLSWIPVALAMYSYCELH